MKKLLVVTGLIAVLGVSAVVGQTNTNTNDGALEATPGVLSVKLTER
ncbi:hypothetical protein SFC66_11610 [Terribacillus saccharophilus]